MLPSVAKPKPWHRLRYWLLAGLLLVATTIAWIVVETRKVQHAQPNVSVDYRAQFYEIAKQHVDFGPDDGAGAWQVMVAARERMSATMAAYIMELEARSDFQPRFEHDMPAPEFAYVIRGNAIPSDAQREEQAIQRLREAGVLEELARFVQLAPGYDPQTPVDPMFMPCLDVTRGIREMAMMRVASMRFAMAAGDYAEVARGAEQVLAHAHTLSLQPGLINSLVAMAVRALVMEEIRHEVLEADFDAATLRSILAALDRFELPSASLVLKGERVVVDDSIQHWFSDDGSGGGYMIMPREVFIGITPVALPEMNFAESFMSRFVLPDRRQIVAMFDEAYDLHIAEAEKPQRDRWRDIDPERFIDELSWRYELLSISLPSLNRYIDLDTLDRSTAAATRIMTALALHRAVHGEYPASLDTLVPDILPELPVDPLHGGPYGYRVVDGDEHCRPYLLYTFGLDGIDNNAHEPSGYNSRLAMTDAEDGHGYDYVFNRPREEWDV